MQNRGCVVTCKLVLRMMPPQPKKWKWARLGPASDWWLVSRGLFGGLFDRLYEIAYGDFNIKQTSFGGKNRADDDSFKGPVVVSDFHWRELKGARHKAVGGGLTEKNFLGNVTLCLFLETAKYVHRWCTTRSNPVARSRRQALGKSPPVCDLVWAAASPFVRTLQYISYLFTGKAKRLVLLVCRTDPDSDFEQWAAAFPEANEQFRRTGLVASCWQWFRHYEGPMRSPWLFAALIDRRRPREERRDILRQLRGLSDESLDSWFGKIIMDLVADEDDDELLDNPLWQLTLSGYPTWPSGIRTFVFFYDIGDSGRDLFWLGHSSVNKNIDATFCLSTKHAVLSNMFYIDAAPSQFDVMIRNQFEVQIRSQFSSG